MHVLTIICADPPENSARSLANLAGSLGVLAKLISPADLPRTRHNIAGHAGSIGTAMVLDANCLASLHAASSTCGLLPESLTAMGPCVLVYGFQPNPHHEAAVAWLTGGTVSAVRGVPEGSSLRFSTTARPFTAQLTGLSFSRTPRASDTAFTLHNGHLQYEVLATLNDQPYFIHVRRGETDFFIWSESELISPFHPITSDLEFSSLYDRLLPFLIFLRHGAPHFLWNASAPVANVILDDPLLRPKYGFLDFHDLTRSLTSFAYTATLAFIPWNYSRTRKRVVPFFLRHSSRLKLCVHGCDHNNDEFGRQDTSWLSWKARLAIQRMEKHAARTGISFDPIMVFPQGRFSHQAIAALRKAGYIASVNSTCTPVDSGPTVPVLIDYLQPAVTCFEGLPIFQRYYPRNINDALVALFLGKPAFLVEHHEFFKDGTARLEHCVQTLNKAEPGLSWLSLDSAVSHTHRWQRVNRNECNVRFFTPIFHFTNPFPNRVLFHFSKPDPHPEVVASLRANTTSTPFCLGVQQLNFSLELAPGERVVLEVQDHVTDVSKQYRVGFSYEVRVLVRRVLSEFRDNYLARHRYLLRPATYIVCRLKISSHAFRAPTVGSSRGKR